MGKKLIFGFLVTVVLLVVLFSFVSVKEVLDTMKNLSLSVILIALFLYLLLFIFRTLRFRTLLSGKIGFKKLFSIVCLHNYFALLLPFRTGEAGYVLLVKKEGVDYPEGVGTLLIARLFDIISIFLIFLAGFLFFKNPPGAIQTLLLVFFLVLFCMIVLILFLIIFKDKFKVVSDKIFGFLKLNNNKLVLFIRKKIGQVLDSVKTVGFNKRSILVLFESLIIWIIMYLFAYLVLNDLGLEISLIEAIIGSSIGLTLIMLPIQGILGFGSIEGALTIAYLILGFSRDSIILASFGYHILSLVFAFLFVFLGWSIYNGMKKSRVNNI